MEKIKKESIKNRIVTAAWQLFYEKGYNGTTVDDIIDYLEHQKVLFTIILIQRMSCEHIVYDPG